MSGMQKHVGSCQCGTVRFEATADVSTSIECNCSHCYRKGLILNFVPKENFTLLHGEDALSEHTFNRHIIKHKFCSKCGVQTFA